MAIKSSRPLVHFSNKGQILGLILEIKRLADLPKSGGALAPPAAMGAD